MRHIGMTTNENSPSNQEILLAGGSGVLGGHIAQALTDAGHKVTGLGRGPGNGIRADLMDRDALLRAVDGRHFDTVIHAATALRKAPMRHRDMRATDALRIEGTAHLIEAARATGARRFIVESIVFGYGYGDFGSRPSPRTTPSDRAAPPRSWRSTSRACATRSNSPSRQRTWKASPSASASSTALAAPTPSSPCCAGAPAPHPRRRRPGPALGRTHRRGPRGGRRRRTRPPG